MQITPRPAWITAVYASKVYGDADPNFTFETSNFVWGEAPKASDYTVTRPSAGLEEGVGSYGGALVLTNTGGFSNRNYSISLVSGNFDITSRPEYTVTYAPGAHGTFMEQVYTVPENSKTPEFDGYPDRESGYTFVGWDKNISNFVTQSVIYTAQWAPSTYQIQYDLDGGTNSNDNPLIYTFGIGVPAFEPATKDGYIFLGWFDGNGQEVTAIADTETGDKKNYAHFKADQTRIEAKPIVRKILKNTTYTWQHTHHAAVLYDEDGLAVDAELWAIIDGKVYDADDLAELPEGVHQVTFTNVNPALRFNPYSRLLARPEVREVTAETTATIIAEEAKPALVTIRYVDQSGKALKTSLVLTGKIGDAVASSAPMITGYELISLSHQVNTIVTDKAQTFTFVYKATVQKPNLLLGTPLPTTGTPLPVTGTPLPTTGISLPRTGETQEMLQFFIGLLLFAVASLLSWLKLSQRFAKARE